MKIDREKALKAFRNYTVLYNDKDNLIKLKIDHTYRVADICDEIARGLNFDKDDIDLAWLLGLLHDVGRFEQLKRFGTLNDAKSVNHAECSVKVLFNDGHLKDYIDDCRQADIADAAYIGDENANGKTVNTENVKADSELMLIYKAVKYHNVFKLPEMDKRTKMFSDLLRDADKIDIIKVNCMTPLEQIYSVSKEQILTSEISDAVMQDLRNHSAVLRKNKCTAIDNLAGHISLAYELVYNISYRILDRQGYIYKLLEFVSLNDRTNTQLCEIKEDIVKYINKLY